MKLYTKLTVAQPHLGAISCRGHMGLMIFVWTALFGQGAQAINLSEATALEKSDRILLVLRELADPKTVSEARVFSVASNASLQAEFDRVTRKIFSGVFGSGLCSLFGFDGKSLVSNLAVSRNMARNIADYCGQFPTPKGQSLPRPFSKGFYLVEDLDNKFPFESWTSPTNETFIFLGKDQSEEEFLARIIHELAISFDDKLLVARQTLETISTISGCTVDRQQLKNSEVDRLLGMLPMPAIKFTFAVIRAMQIEDMLLQQIYGDSIYNKISIGPLLSLLKKNQISEVARSLIVDLIPFQQHLLSTEYLSVPQNLRRERFPFLFLNEERALEILGQIDASKMRFKCLSIGSDSLSESLSLMEWLGSPSLGMASTFFARGPRPRTGGGWSKKDSKQ